MMPGEFTAQLVVMPEEYKLKKEAQFFESIISSIGNEVSKLPQIKTKPFETIFKYLATGIGFSKFGWKIGLLLGVAEHFGFGPSKIGAFIDDALGMQNKNTISKSSLMNVSKETVDRIINLVKSKSAYLNLKLNKTGNIESFDLIKAWIYSDVIISNAINRRNLVKKLKGKQRFSSALYAFLKAIFTGILIHAGFNFVGETLIPKEKKDEIQEEKIDTISKRTWRRYRNVFNNVEKTIINALDNSILQNGIPFSQLFRNTNNKPLVGSNEMGEILKEVRRAHSWQDIEEINRYNTFIAPDPKEIAKEILPEYNYRKSIPFKTTTKTDKTNITNIQEIDQEIGKILGK